MADDKEEPFRRDDKDPSRRATGRTPAESQPFGAPVAPAQPAGKAAAAGGDSSAESTKAGASGAAKDAPGAAKDLPGAAMSGPQSPRKLQKEKKPSAAPGLAAALIIGALSGFGGAYALRYVDALQAPESGDRVAEANARAAALERKSEESAAALAALESRVATVESSAGQASAATDAALTDLRNVVSARPATGGDGAPSGAPQAPGRPAPDLGPIREKIDAVEKKLGSLDRVQKKLAELETAVSAPKVDTLAAAHSEAVVAASLLQAVSRGEPFVNEVAALENFGVDPAKLAPLRATAAAGVASIGDLSDQFAALASSLEDADAPTPETGVLDRLVRDASNLVRIRRAGDPHDADVPGRIAAIKAALARQDVARAYAAWSQLPDAAKAKSASWGAAAKARTDAVAAANAIEADAVAALSKTKS